MILQKLAIYLTTIRCYFLQKRIDSKFVFFLHIWHYQCVVFMIFFHCAKKVYASIMPWRALSINASDGC